jgi:fumarate hydratase subunit alpha
MREIDVSSITKTVTELFDQACFSLSEDVIEALEKAASLESSPTGREVLNQILENAGIASRDTVPLCQDCGTAVVFLAIGQDVHVSGGDLYSAVNEGVRQAYGESFLRKSIVNQPFSARINTRDNTPAVIYTEIIPGEQIKITVLPKGGGAENMTRLGMLTPADGRKGIIDFVLKTVDEAGSNPCPPIIVGVGIGGTAEKTLLLAKKSLLRRVGQANPDSEIADLERELLEKINRLGIGPMGYGGSITALAVNVEVFPAHIASLPVAVNLSCHSSRHREAII